MVVGQELALELKGVTAAYGKSQVLWGVSLGLEPQTLISIIGANGAGKTTLLRTISGLIKPLSGEISAFGQNLKGKSAASIVKMGLSHVPEGRQLFHLMTVKENLESGALYLPQAKNELSESLEKVYQLFPRLAERSKQLAGTLSGGERQMLAIGRALMNRPKLLLVDEPSLGLSPAITQVVFSALKQINQEGVAIILVEQNVRQSLKLAQKAYVLENGHIVKSGTGLDLLHDPDVQKAYLAL
ncbi:MAG: ABC transporter ATP-binding protein [Deinococcales bacterium]